MSAIKKIIPNKFHSNPKILRSVSSILVVDLGIFFFFLIFVPVFFYVDFAIGGYIMMYVCLSVMLHVFILNWTENLRLSGDFFALQTLIVSLSMMYFTGGITSPYMIFLLCISPISFLFFKEKRAMLWSGVSLFCFLVLSVSQIFGYSFQQLLPEWLFYVIWMFNFCLAAFVFIATVRGFQNGLKKVNSKLKKSNTQLKSSNEELERFAYIASHDLKSPLRGIMSFASLLNKKYKADLDERGQEFLQIITTNAEQMNHLIEDILEFSKTNNRELKKEEVDMNKVLEQLVHQIQSQNIYSNGKVMYSDLPVLNTDFTMIKQVFQNLVDNGLKYNDKMHPIVSVQYLKKKDSLYFLIKDNGIGMEENYFERIFEMFQRLHNKGDYQGTGIGLAICKKIVLNLGGEIWVTSKLGEGSIFHISFPDSMLLENKDREDEVEEEAVVLS